MKTKRIVFLTGTRADFGKLKSLIEITRNQQNFDVHIFVTGMHILKEYGYTLKEVEKCGYTNIYPFQNHTHETTMDLTLAKTIEGFSAFVASIKPDLIVVHGDRIEALAGAIVGSLNNVLVAHIEGGEVSGTVDELLRHAVSKMSHIHFVSNEKAKQRLLQMGERPEAVAVIGSPDVDVMLSDKLPAIANAKTYYTIDFDQYAIVLFHPVTTEVDDMQRYAEQFVEALLNDETNYVVIFPNNDLGSSAILNAYKKLENHTRFKIFPSLRFEYFLTLLKNARFIIGNSSAGIREAPYYGLAAINIGTRQQNRALHKDVIHTDYTSPEILAAIKQAKTSTFQKKDLFGAGNSDQLFLSAIQTDSFWQISKQKLFNDISKERL